LIGSVMWWGLVRNVKLVRWYEWLVCVGGAGR
jgi:hypothetical protein